MITITGCAGSGASGSGFRGVNLSVSFEVMPRFEAKGRSNSAFAACVNQYEQNLVGHFSRVFFQHFRYLAAQAGTKIEDLGLAEKDVIIIVDLEADNQRNRVSSKTETLVLNSQGRISRHFRNKGAVIAFRDRAASSNVVCEQVAGYRQSVFNQDLDTSARQLAERTFVTMRRRGVL